MMNRQQKILIVLVPVLLVALLSTFLRWPRQKSVESLKYAPGQKAVAVAVNPIKTEPAVDQGRVLRLDLLDREQPEFRGFRLNLFKPLLAEGHKAVGGKTQIVRPPSAADTLPRLPVIDAEPRRELTQFTFLGYFESDNRKTVFLGRGKDVLLVKAGDTFAGRYKAVSLTPRALTLQVSGTNDQIVIPLLENRPLITAAR